MIEAQSNAEAAVLRGRMGYRNRTALKQPVEIKVHIKCSVDKKSG
jgi:hypothetical protein